ncbi:MAG: DUF4417 domain-containing protein [Duncaniella sp.]|nr:DUF4417 domain-containing protein [Duncaniella sp.]
MRIIRDELPQESLFSLKEMYLMSCTSTGKSRRLLSKSPTQRHKLEHNNMHLMDGMNMSDPNGFPYLKPFNGNIDHEFIPFSKRRSVNPEDFGVHFFEDDYKFKTATWHKLEQTTFKLHSYRTLMCPDHSLFIEEDLYSFLNKESVYRSRFAGAYWQNCGYDVIPTASWGGADSFDYCFESLPKKSIIAVCGVGFDSCRNARDLWEYGLRELELRVEPTKLLIYGEERSISGLSTPTVFIPAFVKSRIKRPQQ